jgi:hypothetical protein
MTKKKRKSKKVDTLPPELIKYYKFLQRCEKEVGRYRRETDYIDPYQELELRWKEGK